MLKLNQPAPDFSGLAAYQDKEFKNVSLADYRGQWLLLLFYPRDFTFICPTELRGFAGQEAEFKEANCSIVAASTDSTWSHKAWFERDLPEVKYPVLADTNLSLSRAYGVLNETDGSAERGLFIIDPEGVVKYILISAGSVGRSVKESLRVLKALQTGDLCPLDWDQGQKTLGKA